MSPCRRLGTVLEPDGNPDEAEGVLNPACARAPGGELLLYPRWVAAGNVSRVGFARNTGIGDDVRFERLGYALEPSGALRDTSARLRRHGVRGSARDVRAGPRPLRDGVHGVRPRGAARGLCAVARCLSLGTLGPGRLRDARFADGDDKDGVFFPEPVRSPAGVLSLAFYHRPMKKLSTLDGHAAIPTLLELPPAERESTRIAYVPLDAVRADIRNLLVPHESVLVLAPDGPWGRLKTGAGTPPVRIAEGWFSLYHAVDAVEVDGRYAMTYSAGIVIHDIDQPHIVLYRSRVPVLAPEHPDETARRRQQRRVSDRHRRQRRTRIRRLLRHGRRTHRPRVGHAPARRRRQTPPQPKLRRGPRRSSPSSRASARNASWP